MFRYVLLVLMLVFYANSAHAKYIYEYLSKVEALLIKKKYDEANKEFQKLSQKVKYYGIKGKTVSSIYGKTVKWLRANDEITLFLHKVSEDPTPYKADEDYGISTKNCQGRNCEYYSKSMIDGELPKTLPFSPEFVDYINNHHKQTLDLFVKTNKNLNDIAESEKRLEEAARRAESERMAEEYRANQKREELKREKMEKEKQEAIDKEIAWINKLSIDSGYSGYANMNLIGMIYKTQKEGGLEDYINKVVGCHKLNKSTCEQWYPKLKAIQILDDGILYSFSEFSGGEYVNITIFTDKEPGKIYQDGQSFENAFYVFKGMFTYITLTGVKKTVPAFTKAKPKLN